MAQPSDSVPASDMGRRKKNVLIPFGGKSQLDTNRRLYEWSSLELFEPGDNIFVFHYFRKSAFQAVSGVAGGSSSTASAKASTEEHPQRPGFTVINIDSPLPPPSPSTPATDTKTTSGAAEEKKKEAEEGGGKKDDEGEKADEEADSTPPSRKESQAGTADDEGDQKNGGDRTTATTADEEEEHANDAAEVEWLPRAVSDALRKQRAASPSSVVVVFQIDSAAGPNSAEVRRTLVLFSYC